MEPILKTYAGWQLSGYHVMKGERARWVEGVPVFSDSQVKKKDSLIKESGDCMHGDYDSGGVGSGLGVDW